MKEPPQNVSESVRRLNPHLYGPTRPKQSSHLVGGLLPAQPKPNPVHPLDKKPQAYRGGTRRLALVVSLIRVGKAMLDDDNLASSHKGLRDAISRTLGVEDNDQRIKWEYGQTTTRGRTGVIVKIERV